MCGRVSVCQLHPACDGYGHHSDRGHGRTDPHIPAHTLRTYLHIPPFIVFGVLSRPGHCTYLAVVLHIPSAGCTYLPAHTCTYLPFCCTYPFLFFSDLHHMPALESPASFCTSSIVDHEGVAGGGYVHGMCEGMCGYVRVRSQGQAPFWIAIWVFFEREQFFRSSGLRLFFHGQIRQILTRAQLEIAENSVSSRIHPDAEEIDRPWPQDFFAKCRVCAGVCASM